MMTSDCDICGFKTPGQPNFCNGCGVDLREPKEMESERVSENTLKNAKKIARSNPHKEEKIEGKDDVMKWCSINALCQSYEMTFPFFFNLVLLLALGKIQLGFCDCAACNRGYRELLAETINYTENKKLQASSREIVIKAREKKIEGTKFDLSKFLSEMGTVIDEKQFNQKTAAQIKTKRGKIMIEIDEAIIENTVLKVLSSDEGHKLINEAVMPRKKRARVGI